MVEAQKAGIRVLLCGTIPDPDPTVDSKLKLLDDALQDLEMGPGNNFVGLRNLLFKDGAVELGFYRKGDIHLSEDGVKIVGSRIRLMLDVMCPPNVQPSQQIVQNIVVQVQAPVQTPAVRTPVVNAPPVVQQLIGQVQDLVIHHVAVPDPQLVSPMEVGDEDEILQRLFLKKFGRALPEVGVRNEVDEINFVIDLTEDEGVEAPVVVPLPIAAVKTEPIEAAEASDVSNVTNVAKARKAIAEFGKSLRKTDVILEKEAPLAAGNVIADTDSNMSEDTTVNPESITTAEAIEMAEQAIAESDAAIAANREFAAEFGDTPLDEFDK